MKSWGGTCLFLGIGSFILPLIGLQFRILSIFGAAQPVISIILIVVGIALLVVDRQQNG